MPLLQTAGHPCHTASRPPGPGVLRLIFSTFGLWPAPPRLFSDRVAGVMEPLRWRILALGSSVAGDGSSVRETLILVFTRLSRRRCEEHAGTVLPSADSRAQWWMPSCDSGVHKPNGRVLVKSKQVPSVFSSPVLSALILAEFEGCRAVAETFGYVHSEHTRVCKGERLFPAHG